MSWQSLLSHDYYPLAISSSMISKNREHGEGPSLISPPSCSTYLPRFGGIGHKELDHPPSNPTLYMMRLGLSLLIYLEPTLDISSPRGKLKRSIAAKEKQPEGTKSNCRRPENKHNKTVFIICPTPINLSYWHIPNRATAIYTLLRTISTQSCPVRTNYKYRSSDDNHYRTDQTAQPVKTQTDDLKAKPMKPNQPPAQTYPIWARATWYQTTQVVMAMRATL